MQFTVTLSVPGHLQDKQLYEGDSQEAAEAWCLGKHDRFYHPDARWVLSDHGSGRRWLATLFYYGGSTLLELPPLLLPCSASASVCS